MAFYSWCSGGEGEEDQDMGRFLSPAQVDQTIRQAIQICWMSLPKEKRNIQEVETQIRRLVDRALRDLHEDHEAFGGSPN